MGTILTILYGIYFIMVGIEGNADEFFTDITQETQFIYWLIAFFIIAGLWESPVAEKVAKPMALLIVIGFLLSNNNYTTIKNNFDALMTGTPVP